MSAAAPVTSATPPTTPARARRSTVFVAVRVLALVAAFALGLAAGITGAFLQNVTVHVGPVRLPLGLLLALGGLAGLLVLTGFVTHSRYALLAPAAGWLVPAFAFSVPRPEGDLIVTSSLTGYGFLLGGSIVIGLALAVPFEARLSGRRHSLRQAPLDGS